MYHLQGNVQHFNHELLSEGDHTESVKEWLTARQERRRAWEGVFLTAEVFSTDRIKEMVLSDFIGVHTGDFTNLQWTLPI